MAWTRTAGETIRWEGPWPPALYHFTGEKFAREILRDRELRPGIRILYSMADENRPKKPLLSFTDDPEWWGKGDSGVVEDDGGLPVRFRIFTKDIPGVRPVVYTTDSGVEPYAVVVSPSGDRIASDAIAHEREWVTSRSVPLLEGRFEVTRR